ncbi:hypothetical protein [Azospira sp.]|uniref:hypothetical protein n=1 Tax=Azospira sp. TaxID=1872671 RepID=UPI002569630D|nr:hypothetical protein [Azospira sp.]MDK9690876.1 hypothetical protein [Azospira sp.]
MPINKIRATLAKLGKKHPVFHSEADFQHALAWELQLDDPTASIRLEKQVAESGKRVHLDLLVQSDGEELAIELKYKTRLSNLTYAGEDFLLRNQSAQDLGRYDFIKDVGRLEVYTQAHRGSSGVAIFLTNDQTYWNPSKKHNAVDSAFRIHEGRVLQGHAAWGDGAADGTTDKRQDVLTLRHTYQVNWSDYSSFGTGLGDQFRYVLLHIPRET